MGRQTSGRHLLSLINDLLDLAKIESGKVELEIAKFPILGLIEEVTTVLTPAAQEKGLVVDVEMADESLALATDKRSLTQILLNLTANAIKFTDKGTVKITVAGYQDGKLKIHVTDTGVGIKNEDQPKLFQAFSQVGKSREKQKHGTGLGLHVSQKLAELLGGVITFESKFGAGSTFTLTLDERLAPKQLASSMVN